MDILVQEPLTSRRSLVDMTAEGTVLRGLRPYYRVNTCVK